MRSKWLQAEKKLLALIIAAKCEEILYLNMGDFQSGQMGQTVNLLSTTSVVRIHHLPPILIRLSF